MKQGWISIIAVGLLLGACTKNEERENQPTNTTNTTNGWSWTTSSIPGGTTSSSTTSIPSTTVTKAEVPMIVSSGTLEDYVGERLESPSDAKLVVNVSPTGSGSSRTYSGQVSITYTEEQWNYTTNRNDRVLRTSTLYSGNSASEMQYNKFHNQNGRSMFKGFFQDTAGALILMVDSRDDQDNMAGSVYYYNFSWNFNGTCSVVIPGMPCNTQGALKCWLQLAGSPYDCRDFLVNSSGIPQNTTYYKDPYTINMTSSERPLRFKKLGDFLGLPGRKAFND